MKNCRFPRNARVAFLGDSIVARNRTMAAIAYYYHKNYPEDHVRFYNCAVSGGSAPMLHTYLEDDVLSLHPTHAVIATAINDSWRDLLAEPAGAERYEKLKNAFLRYKDSMRSLCQRLMERGVAVTLCTPPPYAEYQAGDSPVLHGAYALTAGYAEFIRTLARELDLSLCDYHTYMTERMQGETLYAPDRVHPEARGLCYMADCFLLSQGERAEAEEHFPPEWEAWHNAVSTRRLIYATEWMVVGNYTMPVEEKLHLVQTYLDEGKYPNDYFKNIATHYLAHKPHEAEELSDILARTDALMG